MRVIEHTARAVQASQQTRAKAGTAVLIDDLFPSQVSGALGQVFFAEELATNWTSRVVVRFSGAAEEASDAGCRRECLQTAYPRESREKSTEFDTTFETCWFPCLTPLPSECATPYRQCHE